MLVLWIGAGQAGNYKVEIERGETKTIDVLDLDKAPASATLTQVGNAANGTTAITENKRGVSYRGAADFVGKNSFTYEGRDAASGQSFQGSVEVTVVAPQRIVGLNYGRVAGVLGIILVLAIVLEIGLTTVFNWKYFQENLEGLGIRTPIAVAVSLFFVAYYGLDIVADLLSAFGDGATFGKTLPGHIVTGFVVAGGSATVHRLFAALNLRPPIQDNLPVEVSFDITRGPGVERVEVTIDGKPAVSVSGSRFPASGTHRLMPGVRRIKLEGFDAGGVSKGVTETTMLVGAGEGIVPLRVG